MYYIRKSSKYIYCNLFKLIAFVLFFILKYTLAYNMSKINRLPPRVPSLK